MSLGEHTVEMDESPGSVIRVFGGASLAIDGETVDIGGPRQRRLLALLTIRAGEVVDNDWLSEYVWNDRDRPDTTVSALRTYVSRLRSSFPEELRSWIETAQSGYRLTAPDEALEHRAFSALRTRARQAREAGDPAAAERYIDHALAMWRGEPFRELEDLDWAQAEISRLRLDRLELLEERWEVALALGRHTQITGELAAFTAEHGLRERAARQYALALHRGGRSTEALRVIADHRRVVADASGLEPSDELAKLEEAILTRDPELDRLEEGTPLRGYRLLDQVGSGAFSVVWRGIQPSVERPVAIKQIRAELAALPDFIRRFEVEAQTVARIEHPHIVPLIDFWRDPDAAYLVMRWLPGGTLERLLDEGPLSVERTIAIVEQIGGALAAAHAHDVIHRDVKSANVMFDDLGNAFLTDFGIALAAADSSGPEAALSVGTPAYASPEQLRREPLTPASDVFSLGVVVYECLVGSTPFSDSPDAGELLARQLEEIPPRVRDRRADVPEDLDAAVATAMSKDPTDRFPSVSDFVKQLTAQRTPQRDAGAALEVVSADNPYLGLRAFDQTDSERFFGRRRLVSELVARLSSEDEASRALMVVGPSGSGKSSLVRAGLLPAVRSGAIPGSDRWFVTTMVPGADPYESLEAALLRVAVNPPASLLDQLRDGPRGILRGIRRCLPNDNETVLVLIDQFEELFVGLASPVATQFLDALVIAVKDPLGPLRLVGTLRADYYHRPLEHPTFAPILKQAAVDVTPLAPDELEEAIVGPAQLTGASFEPGLVARVAADAMGQPSPLPLLQHLLAELFERRTNGMLTIQAYEELGGLSGALAERAEAILDAADDRQRAAIRRVFGRLTDPGASHTDLRRRVLQADLGDDAPVRWVLDRYGSARLLTFDRDPATRQPTVEVAHEALLREWPRLVRWLQEDRDLLRSVDAVSAAATVWDEAGRQPSDLLRGPRLAQALDLAAAAPERLRPVDRAFIDASQSLAETQRQAELRQARRLRRLNLAVSVALVIALIAGTVAFVQRGEAVEATVEAEVAALISRSEALVDERPDLAILTALEAHRRLPGPTTERAVLNAVVAAPGRVISIALPDQDRTRCTHPNDALTVSADGATGFMELGGRLITIDLASGETTDRGPAPSPCVRWMGDEEQDIRWATRDVQRATGGTGVLDTRTWTGSWSGPLTEVEIDRGGPILDGTLVGDRILLRGSWLGAVLLDAMTGEVVARDFADPASWAVGADGRHVLIGDDAMPGRLVVLDGLTGEERHRLVLSQEPTALSIHGGTALVGGAFSRLTVIDLESGEVLSEVATSATSAILATGLREDGRAVVVSSDRVEVVDLSEGTVDATVRIEAASAIVRPDGVAVIFDTERRTASLVETQASVLPEQIIVLSNDVAVGFGSQRAAVVLKTGEVELIDLDTGGRLTIDPKDAVPGFNAMAAFPTPDGFVAFGQQAVVARWKGHNLVQQVRLVDQGELEATFAPGVLGAEGVLGAAHAPNGALVTFPLPFSQWLSQTYLVDWTRGVLETRLVETSFRTVRAVGSADGGIHVVNEHGRMRTYDANGRWIDETTIGLRNPLVLARSDQGLIAASGIGGVRVIDPAAGTSEAIEGLGTVRGMSFAGRLLVTVEGDGTVRLSDAANAEPVGMLLRGSGPPPPSMPWFDEERGTVWVATAEGLAEFSLDPARWIEKACEFVGRDLTQEEWDEYVPGDEPLQSACS